MRFAAFELKPAFESFFLPVTEVRPPAMRAIRDALKTKLGDFPIDFPPLLLNATGRLSAENEPKAGLLSIRLLYGYCSAPLLASWGLAKLDVYCSCCWR